MSDPLLRPISPEEYDRFLAHHDRAYGRAPSAAFADAWRTTFDYERSLAAFRDGKMVATAGAFDVEVVVPGRVAVPATALHNLTVSPSERRRGLAVKILERQYADARDRGHVLAAFVVTTGAMYERLGCGPAAYGLAVEMDLAQTHLRPPPVRPPGTVVAVEADELPLLSSVYWRAGQSRPGMVRFDDAYWAAYRLEQRTVGGDPPFFVAYVEDGVVRGYASYRVDQQWPDAIPGNVVDIDEFIAVDPAAEWALWDALVGTDLAATLRYGNLPLDSPLRWLLREQRQLRVRGTRDLLWARILDLPSALGARRYRDDGALDLEIADPLFEVNSGTFRLTVADGAGSCTRVAGPGDVRMHVATVVTLLFGAADPATLVATGRIEVRDTDALEHLRRVFAADVQPWTALVF